MKNKLFLNFIILILSIMSTSAHGAYYGRIISGGFLSKEVFRNSQTDRFNDLAIFSQRLYLNIDKISDTENEFTFDLRDKHNLFDKLNNERIKLIAENKIQLYQLNFHNTSSEDGVGYTLGRFPLSEAGSIHLDGLNLNLKKTIGGIKTTSALFYGLNPNIVDEENITFEAKARAYGAYLTLEDKGQNWEENLYSTTSVVRQVYTNQIDRFYLFNNTNYYSSKGESFSTIFYLDFEPSIYLQNLWTTFAFDMGNRYKFRTSLSTIDTIHYTRIQDIRELLPSSRYHQASFSLRSPTNYNQSSFETKLTLGKREIDKKTLAELKVAAFYPTFIFPQMSGNLIFGIKKNFTANSVQTGFSLLHLNRVREISFSQDVQFEKKTSEKLNNVLTTEGTYTRFFSRSLFGIASIQNVWDKDVSILSLLFKISYRFGEGGQAPLREGSPPMGQL